MTLIAVVRKDGRETDAAEVAAFVDDECRGAVACNNGYYFLTVLGDAQADSYSKVEIRVRVDGEVYAVRMMSFVSDAMYGTLEEPFVLDVDATAIRTVCDEKGSSDDEWYSTLGIKIGRRPSRQGVYIHRGKKVAVK